MKKILFAGCLLSMGCLNSEPLPEAPEDLHGNVAWLWTYGLEASETELTDATTKLSGLFAEVTADAPGKGRLKTLTAENVADLSLQWEPDFELAKGMYLATVLPCSLTQVEDILRADNQMEKYPGTYDRYERTTKSASSWSAEIDSKIITSKFTHVLESELRKVEDEKSLWLRTFMPSKAVFENSTTRFEQNYELEIFVEKSPGELLHVYGVWRDVNIADLGLSTKDNSMVNAIIDNMLARDERTKTLCSTQKAP